MNLYYYILQVVLEFRRRNPANWSYNNVPVNYLIDRGFTGHEHLDVLNLINMNGRVYDPLLGRFMSPDNYIQAPDYTQNFNRYSYALNNPLIYTDPSGDFVFQLFAAWAGNYLIGVADNWINKEMPLGEAFKATPVVAGTNFTPGDITRQNNFGFSNPQVNAHNIANQDISIQISGFSEMDQELSGYGDFVINQQFVGGSPLVCGVAANGVNIGLYPPMALREVGNAANYASGVIGLTQIGMLEYRKSLPIMSKIGTLGRFSSTYRGLGVASKTLGRTATYIGAPLSIGMDYSAYRHGDISLGRFGYRTGSLGVSIGTGAAIGDPWGAAAGAAVGGIFTGFEFIYDSYLVPFGQEFSIKFGTLKMQ